MMKGIILAGGKGTRLRPATYAMNKHMVPILNKPMIMYPLETLKSMGITEILIVTGGEHIGMIAQFLGNGSFFGVSLTYRVQEEAGGIAQALSLAEDFASGQSVAVILGDNIFSPEAVEGFEIVQFGYAHIFVKSVKDPQRFGVLSQKNDGGYQYVINEKPNNPQSDKAVTGLYVYPNDVFDIIRGIVPSARGELEITDVNNAYLEQGRMIATDINQAFWSDAGTPESLAEVTRWAIENK